MSHFKKKLAAFGAILAFMSVTGTAAFADSFLNGQATTIGNTSNVDFNGSTSNVLNVNNNDGKNGSVAQIDWGRLGNSKGDTINFGFSGLSQTIINRVLGGSKSQFFGNIKNSCAGGGPCTSYAQTGKVVLINPAGVLFGAGSQVDLNSFTVSTFDMKGAKNLKTLDMTEEAYLNSLKNGVGTADGEAYTYARNITYDYANNAEFTKAGINMNNLQGKTSIELNGTRFTHDGNLNTNKSVNLVSDNINYQDSVIRTGDNYNYGNRSFGNVNIMTADGITFTYLANGYTDQFNAVDAGNVARTINIDNANVDGAVSKGLDPANVNTTETIRSGDVRILNQSGNKDSKVNISNSIIKATKLIDGENGDIYIRGYNEVSVDKSRLETRNTKEEVSGKTTVSQNGGEIFVGGDKTTVKNSLIYTEGGDSVSANNAIQSGESVNDGTVRIYSYDGDVNVENTRITSKGDLRIMGTAITKIKNSLLSAKNTNDLALKKSVVISGPDSVELENTSINASKDIDIQAVRGDSMTGTVNIKADTNKDSVIMADGKISVKAADTTIDNASLGYGTLKFYNDGAKGTNNLTIKNGATFSEIVTSETGSKVTNTNTIETNGNIVLDNANMQRAGLSIDFEREADKSLKDNGTVNGIKPTTSVTKANTGTLTVRSTEGNVTVQSNSNIVTSNQTNIIADKGDVTVTKSSLQVNNNSKGAGNDLNLTASNGSVNIKDGSSVKALGNDVNIIAKKGIKFGKKGDATVNIDNSSAISGANDVHINSLSGDIVAEKTEMGEIQYGNRLELKATEGSNKITSKDSLKSVNVDYVAGTENNISAAGDIQFVNSSLKSKSNKVEATNAGSKVILNNLEIKVATANAKDTKTVIKAKGNVTTKDVTGSYDNDSKAGMHSYPQSVTTGTASGKNTELNVNKTKLTIKTEAPLTSPNNNSDGSIDILVRNANNKDAGVELTAKNPTWDKQIGEGEGPEVHVDAADNELAISKIIGDKVFLQKDDKMIKSAVEDKSDLNMSKFPAGTKAEGYIEVKDRGGFNMDPDYSKDPDGFEYKSHHDPDPNENINHKHIIVFDNADPADDNFLLVYDRPYEPEPSIEQPILDYSGADSDIQLVKLPRQTVEISKNSKVSDNTVDQTGNIMSAAAKVQVADEDNEDDDEMSEE